MGIVVEDIKLCVCRFVHFSLRISHRFVQKHPWVSGTLSFLLILYIFLPSVLSFLFYSLPFIGFTVILLAFWSSKSSTIRGENGEDKSASSEHGGLVYRNRSSSLRNATSRRRRFKEKSEAWNTEAPNDASVGKADQPIECDSSKPFIEVKERNYFECGNNLFAHSTSVDKNIEVSGQNHPNLGFELLVNSDLLGFDGSSSQTYKSDSGGDEVKVESSEEAEDEDEEEAQEDRNKAVEWTEDDQKNLMDLGLSELERNRRLESLIARRRARKSYKRKVEEAPATVDVIPPGLVKVVTTKNDPFDGPNNSKEMEGGVPMPGSAPSVLLPMRNPFDLPYDPHEEKPNLMADSFQQEFTAAHLKELSFCRHESFCLGPAFPLEDGGGGMGYPRFRRPSDKGDHDWLIEQLLIKGEQVSSAGKPPNVVEIGGESFIQTVESLQIKDDKGTTMTSNMIDVNGMEMVSAQGKEILPNAESEFETEPEFIHDSNDESSHSSSSSENPQDAICVNRAVVSQSFESTLSNALNKSLNILVPNSRLIKEPLCDFSPSAFDKNKMEDRFSYPDKVVCHTPTYSIASDLQVEVSEIGSPPMTVDGSNSHTDGESLSHDWETEKEMNSGGEELWGTSSADLSGIKEKELKSRDVNEANGENINHVQLLGIDMNSENLEQDGQNSLPEEVPNEIISDLQEVDVAGEVKTVPDASATETVQSAMQSTKELVDQPPCYILPHKPEELSNPPDDNEEATNHVTDQKVADGDVDANALGNMENLMRTGEDIDGGLEILMKREDDGKKTTILEETNLECRKSYNDDSENPAGNLGDLDHKQTQERNNNSDQISDFGDLVEPSVHGCITERLMAHETTEQLEFIKDDKNEINVAETKFQISNDAVKSNMEQDSVIEEVPLTVQELEDTTTQPSNPSNVEKSQEPPEPLEKYDEEAHTINNLNDGENSEYKYNKANERESEIPISNEDYITSPNIPVEESILIDNNPKIIENDGNKPVDFIEVESGIIGDLSERNGDKSNLDATNDRDNADQNFSTRNPALNTDMNIPEIIVEGEVALNPLIESPVTEVETEIELAPSAVTNNNIESVGNGEDECESHGFNKQDSELHRSNVAEETNSQFDKDMEGDSKSLDGNETVVSPSNLEGEISSSKLLKDNEEERNVTSLQMPGSGHENSELKDDLNGNSEKLI